MNISGISIPSGKILSNLNSFLDQADRKTLALLDELGAGQTLPKAARWLARFGPHARAVGDDARRHALS
jgi:hypothetical protein